MLSAGRLADGTPSRLSTYVDAKTGKVIRREEHIQTVDGSGQTLYSGTVPLQVTQSGSTYQLKDATRGNTYTTDMNNAEDSIFCQIFGSGCKTGTLFTSPTTTFGNGTNSNRASAGADAQYGTNMTWDYYKNVHGRNGIFGTGAGSFNRVHYGNGYVNAFWDGTKMTYGDGDGVEFGPLVSLDVAGHEMSHGVTEHSANLTYSGESGGLNESTSDIFGTTGRVLRGQRQRPGRLPDRRGVRPGQPRRLPPDGQAEQRRLVVRLLVVGCRQRRRALLRRASGNHFFYLLAEGSGAKTIGGVAHNSPTCNGSTVTGIGRDAAGRDLVPRADGLHDLQHQLRRGPDGQPQRRP